MGNLNAGDSVRYVPVSSLQAGSTACPDWGSQPVDATTAGQGHGGVLIADEFGEIFVEVNLEDLNTDDSVAEYEFCYVDMSFRRRLQVVGNLPTRGGGLILVTRPGPPQPPPFPPPPAPPTSLEYDCAALPDVNQLGGQLGQLCGTNCDVWNGDSSDYDAVKANNFLIGEAIVFAADSVDLADACFTAGNADGNNNPSSDGRARAAGRCTKWWRSTHRSRSSWWTAHIMQNKVYYELRNQNAAGLGSNANCHYWWRDRACAAPERTPSRCSPKRRESHVRSSDPLRTSKARARAPTRRRTTRWTMRSTHWPTIGTSATRRAIPSRWSPATLRAPESTSICTRPSRRKPPPPGRRPGRRIRSIVRHHPHLRHRLRPFLRHPMRP